MIVIDTGSQDRTKDLARALGAQVFDFPWTNDFAAARNESLARASGDSVLVLDADEVLSPQDHAGLLRLIEQPVLAKKAYAFTTRNYVPLIDTAGWTANDGTYGPEAAGSGWFGSIKVRLFPRDPRIRFENPVHELVETSLQHAGIPVEDSTIPIHHYGKLDKQKALAKGEEYYQLGRKKLEDAGENAHALRELAIQAGALNKLDEALGLWQRAITLGTDPETAYLNVASLYLRMDKFAEALAAAENAIAAGPALKESVGNYALCELYAGDARKALDALENLLRKEPDYPAGKILMGVASFCAGNTEKGKNVFSSLGLEGPALSEAVLPFANKLLTAKRFPYAAGLLDALDASDAVKALRAVCAERSAKRISPGRP
jgi:tetratricopeptide (TPR) repeat protein